VKARPPRPHSEGVHFDERAGFLSKEVLKNVMECPNLVCQGTFSTTFERAPFTHLTSVLCALLSRKTGDGSGVFFFFFNLSNGPELEG
jgi:hypothetical protein